jgi:hypothetical protein
MPIWREQVAAPGDVDGKSLRGQRTADTVPMNCRSPGVGAVDVTKALLRAEHVDRHRKRTQGGSHFGPFEKPRKIGHIW